MVKFWRNAAALLLGLSGCATKSSGVVHTAGSKVELHTALGESYRLSLNAESRPVEYLDDHLVEVSGRRLFGALHVRDFKVYEGLHGMEAWVGPILWVGVQLGIEDRNSGVLYVLNDGAASLSRYAGQVVLLEGYVVAGHKVEVKYYRLLAEEE